VSLPPLSPNAWLRYDVISRIVDELRPGSVLEYGAGQGAVGTRLALRADYVGVEPDPVSAAVARQRLADVGRGRLLAGDDELNEERFDLVCAFEVLEHIDDDVGALRQWLDRLRPGGSVLLTVPAYQRRYSAADRMVGHVRRYDPPLLAHRLREAGFTDVDGRLYGFPLGHLLETGRNILAGRKDEAATVAEATGRSGRVYQPPPSLGPVTAAATWPFRVAARAFPQRGVGLIASARRPVSLAAR